MIFFHKYYRDQQFSLLCKIEREVEQELVRRRHEEQQAALARLLKKGTTTK